MIYFSSISFGLIIGGGGILRPQFNPIFYPSLMKIHRIITTVFCCLLAFPLVAQEQTFSSSWIDEIPDGQRLISSEESEKLEKLIRKGIYLQAWIVSLAPLEEAIQQDLLKFQVPGNPASFIAEKSRISDTGFGAVSWNGNLISHNGYVALVIEEDKVYGHIVAEEDVYQIYSSTTQGISILVQKNKNYEGSAAVECHSESSDLESPLNPEPQPRISTERLGATHNCEVRVLVLYTPTADANNLNIVQTARDGINSTNTALLNSSVYANHLRIVEAAIEPFSPPAGWRETSTSLPKVMSRDVITLAGNAWVQQRRNIHGADLVVCLVGGNYSDALGNVADFTDPDSAYALVQENRVGSPNFTFAHEVGHLFNCRHSTSSHAYAKGFKTENFFPWLKGRTILYVSPGSVFDRIPHYSNPSVSYNGKPTGVTNFADNARMLRERGCIVANHLTNNNPALAASVIGPSSGNAGSYHVFRADVSGGGAGAYSYEWRVSTSGTPAGGILSTGYDLWTTIPNYPYSNMYVHLKVTSADGQVKNVTKSVFIYPGGGFYREESEIHFTANVYPNPTPDKIILEINSETDESAVIYIRNQMGQLIRKENEHFVAGNTLMKYNLVDLPAGIYVLEVRTTSSTQYHRFHLSSSTH